MKLDYKKMVNDIGKLVWTDFVADMECKLRLHEKPGIFTQKEAQKMSFILSEIYSISHCLWCSACGGKYKVAKSIQAEPDKSKKSIQDKIRSIIHENLIHANFFALPLFKASINIFSISWLLSIIV